MPTTFYEVLEVSADASQSAITDAYREKVKEFHPDVCDRDDAEEQFKRVKRAEEVLGDPEERAIYDELGHEAYVEDLGGPGARAGASPSSDEGDAGDDVRAAAARAATGAHDDHGGRSAGWRERERRARRGDRTEWFGGVGFDRDDPGRGWTYEPSDDGDGASASADRRASADASARQATDGGTASARRSAGVGASRRAGAGAAADAARRERHAATEAWGNRERRPYTHAVHDWNETDATSRVHWPDLTQDDLVVLVGSLVLYPILLFFAVFPPFHAVANVAVGLLAVAYVAVMLPRPSLGLPVFGTWSVAMPAVLVGLGVPIVSLTGLVTLAGVWVPLLYSAAVAFVLVR